MMVIISYDVSTSDTDGKKRLRKVAKECQNHAQRVQNSVFEADLDYSSFLKLKNRLINIIDEEKDSLRFYYLGNKWEKRVEHIGSKTTYKMLKAFCKFRVCSVQIHFASPFRFSDYLLSANIRFCDGSVVLAITLSGLRKTYLISLFKYCLPSFLVRCQKCGLTFCRLPI